MLLLGQINQRRLAHLGFPPSLNVADLLQGLVYRRLVRQQAVTDAQLLAFLRRRPVSGRSGLPRRQRQAEHLVEGQIEREGIHQEEQHQPDVQRQRVQQRNAQ